MTDKLTLTTTAGAPIADNSSHNKRRKHYE